MKQNDAIFMMDGLIRGRNYPEKTVLAARATLVWYPSYLYSIMVDPLHINLLFSYEGRHVQASFFVDSPVVQVVAYDLEAGLGGNDRIRTYEITDIRDIGKVMMFLDDGYLRERHDLKWSV